MKHFSILATTLTLLFSSAAASSAVKNAVVPQPAEMTVLSGTLTLPATVAVSGPDSLTARLTANASFFPALNSAGPPAEPDASPSLQMGNCPRKAIR